MIAFEKLKPGAVLYDRRRTKMGNTTISELSEWTVVIIAVSAANRTAEVQWNGNRAATWSERQLRTLYNWSMFDTNEAEIERGMLNQPIRVRRLSAKERDDARARSEP